MPELNIPEEQIYFSIGEVSKILGVNNHILRYWEQEFPMLKPQKDESGRRIYRRKEIDTAIKIKKLLYDEKFTIAGARRVLLSENADALDSLTKAEVKEELNIILNILKNNN